MKPLYNKCLVKLEKIMENEYVMENGTTIEIVTPNEHSDDEDANIYQKRKRIFGEVIETPKTMKRQEPIEVMGNPKEVSPYNQHKYITFIYHDSIEQEIKPGDRVYFHYLSNDDFYQTPDDDKLYVIDYSQIFCAVRDGEIIPIGSHVLIEKYYGENAQSYDLPDGGKVFGEETESGLLKPIDKPKQKIGKVKYVGSNFIGFDTEVTSGDLVIFPDYGQFENEIEGEELFVMKQNDILAKIE